MVLLTVFRSLLSVIARPPAINIGPEGVISMRKLAGAFFFFAILLSSVFSIHADSTKLKGVIRAVDTEAATVSIKARRSENVVTLTTNEQTRIIRNGEPARLGDLREGDAATAAFDSATLLATKIEARGPSGEDELIRVEGTIREVSNDSLVVVPLSGSSVLLNVTSRTEITLDGRPARLNELQPGFTVAATYVRSSHEAVRVAAESFAEVRGLIRDIDREGRSFTVATTAEPVTLHVGPNTQISLNDRPAGFDDLRVGFRVVATYIESTGLALRVAAHSAAEITGHIREVDTATGTVAITPLVEGPGVELHVTSSTEITVGGERSTIENLRAGMSVHATFNAATHDALTIAARPLDGEDCTLLRVLGVVAAVDPSAGTLTIDPSSGDARVTLNITSRTEIEVDGREARLSDLTPGMRVEASFCRETLNARHVSASTGGGSDECEQVRLSGVIARVDVTEGRIVINNGTNLVTLNVTSRTTITLDGRPARLSDLAPEMRVNAQFCRENQNASRVAASSSTRER